MAGVEHRVLLVALAEHADGELLGVGVVPDARVGEPQPLNSTGKDRATEPTRLTAMMRHDFLPSRQIVFWQNGRSVATD